MIRLRIRRAAWCIAISAVLAVPAAAIFVRTGERAPVDRLIRNVSRIIAEHPRDAEAHYTLGRLYSLAYAKNGAQIPVTKGKGEGNGLPGFGAMDSILIPPERGSKKPDETAVRQLRESIHEYRRATELDRDTPLYFLGLGWMCEQAFLTSREGTAIPGATSPGKWNSDAKTAYRRAYDLSKSGDLARSSFGPAADSSIAMEAGEGLVRMLSVRGTTDAEKVELTEVRQTLATLKSRGRAITPIVFPLDRNRPLRELLSRNRTTRFDLIGDDVPRRWPWVNGDTGILVWDPEQSGHIASGRQLFGSATWWIFWRNGYDALAALDDDGDGWLSGAELSGIAVWQDRNGNGVSEPGEVRPLGEIGVEAISVRQQVTVEGMPANRKGIRLRDGRMLPTYDWTTSPLR